MTDEQAALIAESIMEAQNMDNLDGFEKITMGRLRAMLMAAAKMGAAQ